MIISQTITFSTKICSMEAMQNILTRNSPRELTEPIPSNEDMQEIYQAAPFRAPMIIILATKVSEHPKVPKVEQMLSTATAAENILLALHAKNYAGMWRTGKFAFNKKLAQYLNLSSDHEVIGYLYVGTPSGTAKKIPELDLDKFVSHWN